MIDKGATTPSKAVANEVWQQVDKLIMQDAAIYPVTSVNFAMYHSDAVHGAVFVPTLQGLDPTNVWLS